ncbi:MAG: TRAP transporter small permease subunit [Alphaproteobacteria bacterium]|nr:TRAP transporter small permease subunit [Alphaproteobacteria bacterium]
MNALLAFSRGVDRLNERIGTLVYWLVLVAVIVSSVNATVRYGLNTSSNAWLELQWYLFAAVFLLCAGYTLRRNEHIRIDLISGRLSKKGQTWIDIIGTVLFLLPMSLVVMKLSWPVFINSMAAEHLQAKAQGLGELIGVLLTPGNWEQSMDAGGLIRWPAKMLIPIGFLLLSLQGISELIKRVAFLMDLIPDPTEKHHDTNLDLIKEIKGGEAKS